MFSKSSYFNLEFGIKSVEISPSNDQRKLKFLHPLMTDTLMHQFETAILLYQNSLERKPFLKLKEKQLFYLVIKFSKPIAVPKACMR